MQRETCISERELVPYIGIFLGSQIILLAKKDEPTFFLSAFL